jgi:hypothetical protein
MFFYILVKSIEFGKSLLKDNHQSGRHNNYGNTYNGNQPYYGPPPQQQYYGSPQQQQYYGPPEQQPYYGAHAHYGPGPSNYNQYGLTSNSNHGVGHHSGNLHGPMAIFKSFDKDGDGNITENGFF